MWVFVLTVALCVPAAFSMAAKSQRTVRDVKNMSVRINASGDAGLALKSSVRAGAEHNEKFWKA